MAGLSSSRFPALLSRALLHLLLATILPISHAAVVDLKFTCLYPAGGEEFYSSDTINATFITAYTTPKVNVVCKDQSNNVKDHKTLVTSLGPGTVWVLIKMDTPSIDYCWLSLVNYDGGTEKGGNSNGYFRIKNETRAATTLGLPSPVVESATPMPTIATWPSSPTTGAPDPAAGTPVTAATSGLSTGAIAGVVIGVVVVVGALVGLGIWSWQRRQRRDKLPGAAEAALIAAPVKKEKEKPASASAELDAHVSPELPAHGRLPAHEMPS